MIELLCVIAIISILASLLLPAVSRAYQRIRGQAEEIEAPGIADLLRNESRNYCTAHPLFSFESKDDFINKCRFSPKCRDWVEASSSEFLPFSYLFPSNEVVLSVKLGRKKATVYSFTKAELAHRPEPR
jgi:type II secretory pathway pseudopilin PulG